MVVSGGSLGFANIEPKLQLFLTPLMSMQAWGLAVACVGLRWLANLGKRVARKFNKTRLCDIPSTNNEWKNSAGGGCGGLSKL